MALANVGRWFQSRGLDVVLVDWDLEAPGLESYFVSDAAQRTSLQGRLGLLDLISTYKDLFPSLPHPAASTALTLPDPFAEVLDDTLPPLAPLLATLPPSASEEGRSAGRLRLLTAGCRSAAAFADYAEAVQRFDWASFYANFQGSAYFEWLRRQLTGAAGADLVLIDSRTGVAEMSGVCTRQLADVVITFCAPNDQNLDGVAMMAESFVRADVIAARGGRGLDLIMVPARIDVSEGRPVDLFEANFHAKLDRFLPPAFVRAGTSFTSLRVPYISAYAFSERLAVGEPEGVKSLQEAYARIGTHLALLSPAGGALRRRCRPDLQSAFAMPSVSVGVLDEDAASVAQSLRERLEESGVFTTSLEGDQPQSWLATAGAVVIVAGSETLGSGRIRPFWRMARENAVCLFVYASGIAAEATLPRWPKALRLWGVESDWDELLGQLQRPCQAARAPFLVPPAEEPLGREDELEKLRQMLLVDENEAGIVAVVGMGGTGKTTLAASVCSDDAVSDAFSDGVLWLGLGPQADVRAGLAKLVRAFEPAELEQVLDLDEARRRLTDLLASRRCLLVYDDLVDASQFDLLPRGGKSCRLLITTRFKTVAASVQPRWQLSLGPLGDEAAKAMLASGLRFAPDEDWSLAVLATRLGGVPLALNIANKLLRSRASPADRPNGAASELVREIDRLGLAAVELPSGGIGGASLGTTMNAAVEQLSSLDRARLSALGQLPARVWTDVADVAVRAGCSTEEATQLVRRLSGVGFVELRDDGPFRVHPLAHEYLRGLQIAQERVETTRIVSRQRGPANSIYISFRRSDTTSYAQRLYHALAEELGADRIFMDVAAIEIGSDFVEVIEGALQRANVVLALIGPDWLVSANGKKRLEDPGDFVRLELGAALQRGKVVIPVLVGGASMPTRSDLPLELADLAFRNSVILDDRRFNSDMDILLSSLKHVGEPGMARAANPSSEYPGPHDLALSRKPSRRLAVVVGVSVLAGLAIGGFWTMRVRQDHSQLAPPDPSTLDRGAAEFSRAEDLYYGRGGKKDVTAALNWYSKAAELGNASAQNILGRLYENGEAGLELNRSTALEWYRKAAQQGHPDARAALLRLQSAK